MAVDLISYRNMEDPTAIEEAASQGIKTMEHLIRVMSQQQHSSNYSLDCSDLTDLTVAKFKKVISLLNRTGHARFRRGPAHQAQLQINQNKHVIPITSSPYPSQLVKRLAPEAGKLPPAQAAPPQSLTLDFSRNNIFSSNSKSTDLDFLKESFSVSGPSSSFLSSAITGDGSVSNGKGGASIFLASAVSGAKPPLSSGGYAKKRCHKHDYDHRSDDVSGKFSGSSGGSGKCHCSKRRKNRVKKTIRVPAISSKIADMPPDEYSWRKYGQKPIKGSPYPRGYYKCSTMRGCPARKHVERATDDPTMLIVSYEGEHRHTQPAIIPEHVVSTIGLVFQST